MKQIKLPYEKAEIEFVLLQASDIITASDPFDDIENDPNVWG